MPHISKRIHKYMCIAYKRFFRIGQNCKIDRTKKKKKKIDGDCMQLYSIRCIGIKLKPV